jgi:hypothetical protein
MMIRLKYSTKVEAGTREWVVWGAKIATIPAVYYGSGNDHCFRVLPLNMS